MTPRRLVPLACCAALLLALAAPRAESGESLRGPSLDPAALDLLPLDAEAHARFQHEHGPLIYRTQVLDRQLAQLRGALAKRKNRGDAEGRKQQAEIRRVGVQVAALMARLTDELQAYGVDGPLVAYMNHAPRGEGRLERYGHGLVLLLDDLDTTQRTIFQQVVTEVDAAYHVIAAQKERTMLALKQSELPAAKQREVARTFDRQLRVVDQRFWLLVDYLLTRDQKVAVWRRLPRRLKVKSQAVEHMYALPGLSVSQAARLKALVTETEQEASPDSAAVRRLAVELRNRKLPADERKRLTKERSESYRRLAELDLERRKSVREILTDDQWLDYLAIPPRISINERSGSFGRVLSGWPPTPAQRKAMDRLARDAQAKRRAASRRIASLRREGADIGPDSPQMMSMEMEMAGARAQSATANRDYVAAIFAHVMTPEEVCRWVLGHWGYKR